MSYADVWLPPANVTGHAGKPIGDDERFFVAPPIEIGTVLSASSQVRRSRNPLVFPMPVRIAATIVAGFLGCWLAYWVLTGEERHQDDWAMYFVPVLTAMSGYYLTSRTKYASFVGNEGFCRIAYPAEPGHVRPGEMMLFRDAAHLRTKKTKQYYNGVYGGTEFSYVWSDAAGKKLMALKGRYRESKLFSRTSHDFHLAEAAEEAWSRYLLDRAHEHWQRGYEIQFPIVGKEYIALSPGYIDINLRGKSARISPNEIGGFAIKDGYVTLRHRDAKSGFLGLGGAGVYTFAYGNLANARLFLLLLAELCREDAPVPA